MRLAHWSVGRSHRGCGVGQRFGALTDPRGDAAASENTKARSFQFTLLWAHWVRFTQTAFAAGHPEHRHLWREWISPARIRGFFAAEVRMLPVNSMSLSHSKVHFRAGESRGAVGADGSPKVATPLPGHGARCIRARGGDTQHDTPSRRSPREAPQRQLPLVKQYPAEARLGRGRDCSYCRQVGMVVPHQALCSATAH